MLQSLLNGSENPLHRVAFKQKIGSAIRERPFFGFVIEARREHQHLRGARQGLDRPDGVQPTGPAHLEVQQYDIRPGLAGQRAQDGIRGMKSGSAPDARALFLNVFQGVA